MTAFDVIENKISAVEKYLKILERYQPYSKEEIESDVERRGAVERYLYLVSQATIDLAEAIISVKRLRKPTTLAESFYILQEEKIIPQELTLALVKMVGFRNVLSHGYTEIDYEIVIDVLKNRIKDIEKFLKIVKALS